MEKPMKASVVPAKEQADRSVYEALAMLITDGRAWAGKLSIGTGSNTCTASSVTWILTFRFRKQVFSSVHGAR